MDNLPAIPWEGDLPDLPDGGRPQMSADAELILPAEVYAPWMRTIQSFLEKSGARNGQDYRAMVSTAGYDEKKRALYRVKWVTLTDSGVLYLNLMAASLRLLPQEQPQIGIDVAGSDSDKTATFKPESPKMLEND